MNHQTPFAPDCLKDQLILITGGYGALGKVIIRHLHRCQAIVLANDIVDSCDEEDVEQLVSRYYPADNSHEKEVLALFDKTSYLLVNQ